MPNISISDISENELFIGMNKKLIQNLSTKESIEFVDGDIIFKIGDPAEYLYLIIEGEVKLKIQSGLSSPVVVRRKKDQYFGEIELLGNTPRKSSSVAESNCVLLPIIKSDVTRMAELSPEFKSNVFGGNKVNEGIRRRDIVFSDKTEKISDIPFLRADKLNINIDEDSYSDVIPDNVAPLPDYIPQLNNDVLLPPGMENISTVEPDTYDYSKDFLKNDEVLENTELPSSDLSFDSSNNFDSSVPFPPEPEIQTDDLTEEIGNKFSFSEPENFDDIENLPEENENKFSFSEPENFSNVEDIPAENNKFSFTADNSDDFIFNSDEDISFKDDPDIILHTQNNTPEVVESEIDDGKPEFHGSPTYNDDTYLDILVAIQKIGSSIVYSNLFSNITSAVTDLLKCQSTFLYIADFENNVLLDSYGNKLDINDSEPGICYSSREIIYSNQSIFVPVENKDGIIISVLQLFDSVKGDFDKKDEQIINAVIPFIADVIENSKLLNLEKLNRNLDSLGLVSQLLVSDIKRPLLMIRHYVEYLKQKDIDPDGLKILELISEQAGNVLELSQTVKEFSQNIIKVNLIECEITLIMDEYLSLLAEYTDSRKVKVLRKYEGQGTALIDKRKFYQAIYQLVKNACDSMPDGGKIYFIIRRNDPQIEIEIKDEGIGIPPEILPEIMKPFMTYGKRDAAGLGLNIVEEILNKHKGYLTYTSIPGEGSTFTVSIPAADIF